MIMQVISMREKYKQKYLKNTKFYFIYNFNFPSKRPLVWKGAQL